MRTILLLTLVGFCAFHSRACARWESLTVKLFNDAAVGPEALEAAQTEAAWLLESVCVQVTWVPCRIVPVPSPGPCAPSANGLEVHILASSPTADIRSDAMGLAIPTFGSRGRAGVFLSRVQATVNSNAGLIDLPPLLGHVMAHEIGHLLLRSSVHSSEGLMRSAYRPSDLKKAGQRQLRFTPEQISTIQARLFDEAR